MVRRPWSFLRRRLISMKRSSTNSLFASVRFLSSREASALSWSSSASTSASSSLGAARGSGQLLGDERAQEVTTTVVEDLEELGADAVDDEGLEGFPLEGRPSA